MQEEVLSTSSEERVEALASSDMFAGLGTEDLKSILALCKDKFCQEGESILTQGNEAKSLYVILTGKVVVERNIHGHTETALTLGRYRTFGWVALIEKQRMSSTIRTTAPAHLLEMSGEALKKLLGSNAGMGYKVMSNLSIILAKRLNLAYQMIEDKSQWENLLL
ncbi:MAG: cyclic nucleotide-binding domain-containing protein [Chloroflexi bacterium]|nr:cyclic nucleotide-binding domain-containing protein [Chloroflexota bacterium]